MAVRGRPRDRDHRGDVPPRLVEEATRGRRLMSRHDDLLNQGPRQAPEPETAEEKSSKLGLKTAGGAVAGGGAVAAKAGALGGFGKVFLWLFVWNGVNSGWGIGGC